MRLRLTDEQKRAAATHATRAYIEAAPGSGKTTVAAERYGVIRYDRGANGRGTLALSFARSARGELERRVRRRWGAGAMRWPHKVWTLDSLHWAIVTHLLKTGVIEWPGGHTDLIVVDSWRGHPGSRILYPNNYQRVAILNGKKVGSGGVKVTRNTYGYGNKVPYEKMLATGICTHDEIRQVLDIAVGRKDPQAAIREYFAGSTKAVIVDEVFDGNIVDLRIVYLAAQAGIPTTVIGDPWQALYDFRGARPELVPELVNGLKFETFPVGQSFRFETREMQHLARRLRTGEAVTLLPGAAPETDAVLASHWEPLWAVSDQVLPFSFGQIGNRVDAAMGLLLDRVVTSHFGALSSFGPEAAVILDLEPEVLRAEAATAFNPVLDRLSGGTTEDAAAALAVLRKILLDMGSKSLPKLAGPKEAERVERLRLLAQRLGKTDLVPGMTVHQAKGREWINVGVHFTPGQQARLAGGLLQANASDRLLYVALTRAKRTVRLV